MAKIPVVPDVVIWVRKQRGLTQEQAAAAMRVDVGWIEALESGAYIPNMGELRKLAAAYRVSLPALLMPEPLPTAERRRVPDFRVRENKPLETPLDLAVLIEEIHDNADALANLKSIDPDILPSFEVPKIDLKMDAEFAASSERKRLGIDLAQQMRWGKSAQAFQAWRNIIEDNGVFVYVMKAASVEDWSGLAVYDDREIPIVVINQDEGETTARNFSLIHEYCHIMLRRAGLSDQNRTNAIEAYCNKFAAHFLMPRDGFTAIAEQAKRDSGGIWDERAIKRIASAFHTSMQSVALHLENTGLATPRLYEQMMQKWRVRKPRKGGGTPQSLARRRVGRYGVRHVSVVLGAHRRGTINTLEASSLLDASEAHFAGMSDDIIVRRALMPTEDNGR